MQLNKTGYDCDSSSRNRSCLLNYRRSLVKRVSLEYGCRAVTDVGDGRKAVAGVGLGCMVVAHGRRAVGGVCWFTVRTANNYYMRFKVLRYH